MEQNKTIIFERFAQLAAKRLEEKKKFKTKQLKIKSMDDMVIEIRGLSDAELNEVYEFSDKPVEVDRYLIYYASKTLQETAKILVSDGNLKSGDEYKITEIFSSTERNFVARQILELSGATGDAGIEVVNETEEIKNF